MVEKKIEELRELRNSLKLRKRQNKGKLDFVDQGVLDMTEEVLSEYERQRKRSSKRSLTKDVALKNLVREIYNELIEQGKVVNDEDYSSTLIAKAGALQEIDKRVNFLSTNEEREEYAKSQRLRREIIDILFHKGEDSRRKLVKEIKEKKDKEIVSDIQKELIEKGEEVLSEKEVRRIAMNLLNIR